MKPLAPNTLLQNRYLVVQLIGKGGMGEVYLAVDQRLGSAMALKRTTFNDDEMLKAAFEREAKILAMLRHSVLPKVSDHFIENEVQYLVMEHISGDDLAKRLEDLKQPFPLNWVLFWADQLLDALAYLHSHEPPIIHRDIKPQNLKLTNENHIILLDFGLAKNSIGETRLTTSGTLSGYTPHYASMEQIRGTGTTAQSDLYSLSATLYQLLTNTVPPDALTRADKALNNSPDPVRPLYEINHEISLSISDVILKGMSLSIERRYRTAREMQTALREAHAEMQQIMSAQTIAFNAADVTSNEQTPSLPQPQNQTQQYSAPIVSQPYANTPQIPSEYDYSAQETNADIYIPVPIKQETYTPIHEQNFPPVQEQNFDATIRYDGPVGGGIGEKTEVLPNNSFSPPPVFEAPVKDEQFNLPHEPVKTNGEVFDAGATVPLISFGDNFVGEQPSNKTEVMNYVPVSQPNVHTEAYRPEDIFPEPEEVPQSTPPPVKETPKKKSSGKIFIILGVLLVLAFIGLGIAGAAVYFLKPSIVTDIFGGVAPTPTPEPTPTVETTPTPTATPTPTPEPSTSPDTNTSTNTNSISNNGLANANDQGNTKGKIPVDKTPRPLDTPTNDKTPRPTPTQRTTSTPKLTPTPVKQPTRDPSKVV